MWLSGTNCYTFLSNMSFFQGANNCFRWAVLGPVGAVSAQPGSARLGLKPYTSKYVNFMTYANLVYMFKTYQIYT